MAAISRFTRRVWKSFLNNGGHETAVFPSLKLGGIGPGRVNASFTIEEHNLNRGKVLHGGVILSLTDTMGSLAVATKGQWMTGVSTDINASFVKPGGKLGDMIFMESRVVGFGKNMAYTRTEFCDRNGQLLAYGSKIYIGPANSFTYRSHRKGHTKFLGKTINHPKNVKFSEDGESVIEGQDLEEDVD
ncbi:hypothetical protein FRC14_000029 [Serendipita sp. 396]|nr:hypothetical protein FRC14_000029 [Serendipita sp. 396]